jgi:hypothetical protein
MIELIHDPFCLWNGDRVLLVDSPKTRQLAFQTIDERLRAGSEGLQILISTPYWKQFKSAYRDFKNVALKEITPTSMLSDRLHQNPPSWLKDEFIHAWGLTTNGRVLAANESWPKWIIESVFPGNGCSSYADWFRAAYSCKHFKEVLPFELMSFLRSKIRLLLEETSLDEVIIAQVLKVLDAVPTMHKIAETVLSSPAICPLLDRRAISSLSTDRLLAEKLPIVFPLPKQLHQKVSMLFLSELKDQRINKNSLSEACLLLNADWDHISDELAIWLKQYPTSLTAKAAKHLQNIPVREEDDSLRQLAVLFAPAIPPDKVWTGVSDLTAWNRGYNVYIRSAFSRRQLPESWNFDPAKKFTEWLQTECVSLYNDVENSFVKASRAVRDALSGKQTVILCVLDAFAYHLEDILTKRFSDELSALPTEHWCIFAPVPTITEVAKMAVATGLPPNQCPASWEAALCQAYSLLPDELLLATEWQDVDRVQPMKKHRLIVYRDNRIDDALQSQRNYTVLREEVDSFCMDMAKRVHRWVEDLNHINGKKPSVFVTADHGFTFGPPSNKDGITVEAVGHHRCKIIDEGVTLRAPNHLARLDKNEYHLASSYLSATRRGTEQGTISGWIMQHGGLLPEEVLIPVIRWFGIEKPLQFADVSLSGKAVKVDGKWKIDALVNNRSGLQINQIQISLALSSQPLTTKTISRLKADEERSLEFLLHPGALDVDNLEELNIVIQQSVAGREAPKQKIKVPVYRALMEPDNDFENMF